MITQRKRIAAIDKSVLSGGTNVTGTLAQTSSTGSNMPLRQLSHGGGTNTEQLNQDTSVVSVEIYSTKDSNTGGVSCEVTYDYGSTWKNVPISLVTAGKVDRVANNIKYVAASGVMYFESEHRGQIMRFRYEADPTGSAGVTNVGGMMTLWGLPQSRRS